MKLTVLNSMLVFGTLTVLLSGCSPQNKVVSNTASKPPIASSHAVTILSSTNANIPADKAKNPISAAEAAMSWRLSNGTTVRVSSNSDVVGSADLGDVSVVTLRVPDVKPQPAYYFLFMLKEKDTWSLKGILGAPLEKNLEHSSLPPYTHLIDAGMHIKGVGRFEEFYSLGKVITIADISVANASLPSGRKVQLKSSELPTDHISIGNTSSPSSQLVTMFSQGNETGLYYRFGPDLIWVAGNVSDANLLKISKDLKSHPYVFLKAGYSASHP